jgi:hypothetical protein
MFDYEVMSETEAMAERFQLIKAGEYDAVITASKDAVSSSGNPMMDMTVCVYDNDGNKHEIRDFLVFTKTMMWKVIHFVTSAGILTLYESRKLCSDTAINCRVRVKVGVEEGKEIPEDKLNGKPYGSKYPDKNKIEDYLKRTDKGSPLADEDVPF